MKKVKTMVILFGGAVCTNFALAATNLEGIAIDTQNKLAWQDEPYTKAERDAYLNDIPKNKVGNFIHAKAYCDNLSLGGYKDWKLPSKEMLINLYSGKKIVKNIVQSYYWSSSPVVYNPSHVWSVDSIGSASNAHIRGSDYIRCVREIK